MKGDETEAKTKFYNSEKNGTIGYIKVEFKNEMEKRGGFDFIDIVFADDS